MLPTYFQYSQSAENKESLCVRMFRTKKKSLAKEKITRPNWGDHVSKIVENSRNVNVGRQGVTCDINLLFLYIRFIPIQFVSFADDTFRYLNIFALCIFCGRQYHFGVGKLHSFFLIIALLFSLKHHQIFSASCRWFKAIIDITCSWSESFEQT